MADTQTEEGFTKITNKLFEAILRSSLSLRELKVILTVIRYTDGFHRDEAELAIRFIAKATGIDFSHINKAIAHLKSKNVLSYKPGAALNHGRNIILNKDYNTWNIDNTKEGYSGRISNSGRISHSSIAKTATDTVAEISTKKEINKENINKIFTHWNSKNIVNHKHINNDIKTQINNALKEYSADEVIQAIDNYKFILEGSDYYFKYKWTLKDFLKRGLEKFIDKETAENNYISRDCYESKKTADTSLFEFKWISPPDSGETGN